jgi:hypothetical protein
MAETEDRNTASPFLWSEGCSKRATQVQGGTVLVSSLPVPSPVPGGMIHDWIGAICIPGATLARTLSTLQDYRNHKLMYCPEVIESELLSRDGSHFEIYLRLVKKKVRTVVLDTWHAVDYSHLSETRAYCQSRTTRVCEIEHPGTPHEMAYLPDTGHGFLWRLYSHWKLEEKADGVWVECRAISLTRDIPAALAWIVGPMVHKLPAESLKSTLDATRRALTST